MTTTELLSPAHKGRSTLAALCCGVLVLYSFYLGAVGITLPAVRASFKLTAGQAGLMFPCSFTGFVVGVIICGYMSDRLGRKSVMLFGIAMFAVGLLLFGTSAGFLVALLGSACIGAGTGITETMASAMVSDLYPERRAFVLNTIQIAFGLGAALSPMAAQRMLGHGISWRWYYAGLAGMNIVLFAMFSLRRVPRALQAEALDFATLRKVLLRPVFGALCLAEACYVGAEVSFFSWMPTYFQVHLIGGAAYSGAVVMAFWLAMTAGRIMTSMLVEKVALHRLIALMGLAGALFASCSLAFGSPLVVVGFVCLTGFAFSGIWPLVLAEGGERFPEMAGTAFGGIVATGGIGGAVLPWVVGTVSSGSLGWRPAMMLVPLAALSVAVIALSLTSREKKRTFQSLQQ